MSRRLPCLLAACWALASQLSATVVDYHWTGSADSSWESTGNWGNQAAPADVLTDRAIFGPRAQNTYIYANQASVYGLAFKQNENPYVISARNGGITLGGGGISYNPAADLQSRLEGDVELKANQTWDIQRGSITISGAITDSVSGFTIEKTGGGTLVLDTSGSSGWSGGIVLTGGTVVVGPRYEGINYSLGTNALTFNGGTLRTDSFYSYYGDEEIVLRNTINSSGRISIENELTLRLAGSASGGGGIQLSTDTTLATTGRLLYVDGNIVESGSSKKLTINSSGAVVLDGDNTYSGGTHVERGLLIFGNPNAVPQIDTFSNRITVAAGAYAGYASTTNFNVNFLARFNRLQTLGTIGLDTDPVQLASNGSPNIFTQNINLGGQVPMLQARLGSATAAILSGSITPADGTNYRFGGGGGMLLVASSLTGPGSVDVTSPTELPLTLRLSGENSYQGGTHVQQSALTFDNATALPSSGLLTMGVGGYIGIAYTPANSVAGAFLGRFGTLAAGSMIGFDSADIYGTYREIADNIDLSAGKYAGVLLGTSTNVGLSGSLTPNANTYRLGAYKGGFLTVLSQLTGDNAVVIGHPDVQGTVGDRNNEEFSRVYLANTNNNYTGGTTLHPGHLIVGGVAGAATNALGTGTLTVNSTNIDFGDDAITALITPSTDGITLPNAIVLNAGLDVGGVTRGNDNSSGGAAGSSLPTTGFNLTGVISGPGKLFVGDETPVNLRLAGDNTFSGGIYVRGGSTLALATDTAAGTGMLSFGSSSSAVLFESATPVIGGLYTEGNFVSLSFSAVNPVLTVNQTADGKFDGYLYTSNNSRLNLVKTGTGTLFLSQGGIASGTSPTAAALPTTSAPAGLTITQGALVIGNSFTLDDQSSGIHVNGGTLVLEGGKTLKNPLLIENGGVLAGFGSYSSAVIGAGATLSPGFSDGGHVGFLHFEDHLELAGGGTYEWHIANADPFAANAHDGIFVGSNDTLEITATANDRFTLKLISLDLAGQLGVLSGLDPMHGPYTWSVARALSLTGSADFLADAASVFDLDTSGFDTGGLAGSFSLSSANNQLLLTFTPVPEPSTYALMALGLGFIAVTVWRRRRA